MDNTKVIKEEKTVAFRERKRILFFRTAVYIYGLYSKQCGCNR